MNLEQLNTLDKYRKGFEGRVTVDKTDELIFTLRMLLESAESASMCNWCHWMLLSGTKRTQDSCTCGRRLGYERPTWCCENGDSCCDGCEHTRKKK